MPTSSEGAWGRAGLIGATGFVGGILARQRRFERTYSSQTISDIAGERFDTLVCCGAPAVMWVANANPEADRANLDLLADRIEQSDAARVVLISTIAVLDDMAAGYTEETAQYETVKAYGKNRRALEERVLSRPGSHVLRLPALFGPGLKKNFVFDILNPIPSFIKVEAFAAALARLEADVRAATEALFALDDSMGAYRLDRAALGASPRRAEIEAAFAAAGLIAANFTNADSEFQYYNLARLADDIDTCVARGIDVLHVSSPPWRAGDVYQTLTGRPFANASPPVTREDMRTIHAAVFGASGDYLYTHAQARAELVDFARANG